MLRPGKEAVFHPAPTQERHVPVHWCRHFHASKEALALAQGMDGKHAIYHTGFGGSKIVVDCNNPSGTARALLLDEVADVLNEFEGTMYTGGDLNTTERDMEYLFERTPYVLAGLCNPVMDPNMATAYGGREHPRPPDWTPGRLPSSSTAAARSGTPWLESCWRSTGRQGVRVRPRREEMASVHGSTPVTGIVPDHDVFVPCSASGILDEAFARALPAKHVVGATNVPFLNQAAEAIFREFCTRVYLVRRCGHRGQCRALQPRQVRTGLARAHVSFRPRRHGREKRGSS